MKFFVLTYDPTSCEEARVQEFQASDTAFEALLRETLNHLERRDVEVVLFHCDSIDALRSTNQRYFRSARVLSDPDQAEAAANQRGEFPQPLRDLCDNHPVFHSLLGEPVA